VHFHILFVDGVYDVLGAFAPIEAPTRAELEALCTSIAGRVHKLLERRAVEHHDERALCIALSRSAARRGASKHAPEGTDPDHDGEPEWKLKARVNGFDLEATTVSAATSCAPHWPTDACACSPRTKWRWSSRAPGRTERRGSR